MKKFPQLSEAVQKAAGARNVIDAIKIYREETGSGLYEAHKVVKAHIASLDYKNVMELRHPKSTMTPEKFTKKWRPEQYEPHIWAQKKLNRAWQRDLKALLLWARQNPS